MGNNLNSYYWVTSSCSEKWTYLCERRNKWRNFVKKIMFKVFVKRSVFFVRMYQLGLIEII
jgi:hypothetical protein